MALADYFGRAALAAAQILQGFDEAAFRATLGKVRVGLTFGGDATKSSEGRALLDLTVRLVSRLYPTLVINPSDDSHSHAQGLSNLARAINPNIEFGTDPTIEIAVGMQGRPTAPVVIYAGSNGWESMVGTHGSRPVAETTNPFGAGAAACIACANVFRCVFLGEEAQLDERAVFSAFRGPGSPLPIPDGLDVGEAVLFGSGATGMAALWAFGAASITGVLHLVDHQTLDLGNLQRYVLATRAEVGRTKVDVVSDYFSGRPLRINGHAQQHGPFLAANGYRWDRALLALDSARDRRAVQASLPKWITNCWTQPGDLGVSTHSRFGSGGACVACLYLPEDKGRNEDQIVADALGVPERLMEVRVLLHNGAGVPESLLEAVAAKLDVPIENLQPFSGRPIRDLYVEGICGGQVLPLAQANGAPVEVHVPLAHQSALAGVLLAAEFVADVLAPDAVPATRITRVNLQRALPGELTQPALASDRGLCICQDDDYRAAYARKYASP